MKRSPPDRFMERAFNKHPFLTAGFLFGLVGLMFVIPAISHNKTVYDITFTVLGCMVLVWMAIAIWAVVWNFRHRHDPECQPKRCPTCDRVLPYQGDE